MKVQKGKFPDNFDELKDHPAMKFYPEHIPYECQGKEYVNVITWEGRGSGPDFYYVFYSKYYVKGYKGHHLSSFKTNRGDIKYIEVLPYEELPKEIRDNL